MRSSKTLASRWLANRGEQQRILANTSEHESPYSVGYSSHFRAYMKTLQLTRMTVRDEEPVGSNPATPTSEVKGKPCFLLR